MIKLLASTGLNNLTLCMHIAQDWLAGCGVKDLSKLNYTYDIKPSSVTTHHKRGLAQNMLTYSADDRFGIISKTGKEI